MFRLAPEEWNSLRSQFATLEAGRGRHRKYLPLAFTEHGAIMAATILNTARARQVSIYVVRAFTQLRNFLASTVDLARRLDEIERRLGTHDEAVADLIQTIRRLMAEPQPKRRSIGFVTAPEGK